MLKIKNLFRIFIDVCLITLALVLATVIRIEGSYGSSIAEFLWEEQLFLILPFVILIKLVVLAASGTYRKLWRYTNISEIISLARTLLIASLFFVMPRLLGYAPNQEVWFAMSYGVIAIDYLLSLVFLAGLRLIRFYIVEQRNIKMRIKDLQSNIQRTLVVGAGEAALEVVKTIDRHPELGLKVVAALDDDSRKHGMYLTEDVEVKSSIDEIKYWVEELAISQIVVAIPSADAKTRRRVNLLCNDAGVDIRAVPGVDQLAGGHVTVENIRKLSMEDLLGREEIDLNLPEVLAYLKGKRVLITGAGGSIGSEICRQLVSKCQVDSVCLLGKGENSIFSTMQIVNGLAPEMLLKKKLFSKIADIRNETRVKHIFEEFKPHVVFHAAAHKHVHLMELNPCEAFENNVLGTQNLARIAGQMKVERFVLVSTDKAVNPTSIMGATKRLAEQVTLMASKEFQNTTYTAVRFGNVLGSRGSVIKVWEQQLRNGQAITVTHKDAIRYFMTIPEAAQLVIKASGKAHSGEIMVLDMGEPVKIYELAKQFIHLSGFDLEDVPIEVIGLREGEKLYEELLTAEEFVESRLTEKIFKAKLNFGVDHKDLVIELDKLVQKAKADHSSDIKKSVMKLVNPSKPDKKIVKTI